MEIRRSLPKVPHWQQYLTSGIYFGKVKITERTFKKSLETTVWTIGQLKSTDFLKQQPGKPPRGPPGPAHSAMNLQKERIFLPPANPACLPARRCLCCQP